MAIRCCRFRCLDGDPQILTILAGRASDRCRGSRGASGCDFGDKVELAAAGQFGPASDPIKQRYGQRGDAAMVVVDESGLPDAGQSESPVRAGVYGERVVAVEPGGVGFIPL